MSIGNIPIINMNCLFHKLHYIFCLSLYFFQTIKYNKSERLLRDDGTEYEQMIEMEKQTTPDRLGRVSWDEDKTWNIVR